MDITSETKIQPRAIALLNDILICLHESEKGYDECADIINSEKIKPFLRAEAEARLPMIESIEGCVFKYGSSGAARRRALVPSFHRIFFDTQSLLASGNTEKILDEIKCSEKKLTGVYREALDYLLPEDLHKILEKHVTYIQKKIYRLNTIDASELAIDEANNLTFPASDPPVFKSH